jgi:beta-N-acetylhexosaminidase
LIFIKLTKKDTAMKRISLFSFILVITSTLHATIHNSINPSEQLQKMSLRQKIAQLMIIAAVSNEIANKDFLMRNPYRMNIAYIEDLISIYQVGGIIFLGGGFSHEQADITKRWQALSPHIPLFIALDAEWGVNMRLVNGFRFPHNMTLGALTDNELIYQMAYEIGRQLAELGVHINLAPVVDVNNNPFNPVINERSFGGNPENVAEKGVAYIKGTQDAGIIACAKHFPGHGDTNIDSHKELPIIPHDRDRLDRVELRPFKEAIDHNVKAIMTAHLQVPALDPDKNVSAALSKKITTDLLRTELGFQGLIITDGLGMQGVTDHCALGELEVRALEAGADILLCPIDPLRALDAIEQAVTAGRISEQSINEKVLRVLQAKEWAFAHADGQPADKKRAMQIKKEMFAKAITLVKDTLDPQRDKTNDAFVTITGMHPYKQRQFGISDEKLTEIAKLKYEGKNVTVILYGSPYAIELVQIADRIIVAYEDDGAAQEAVQQILAGHATACGILPV